jgi:hypothetical protein
MLLPAFIFTANTFSISLIVNFCVSLEFWFRLRKSWHLAICEEGENSIGNQSTHYQMDKFSTLVCHLQYKTSIGIAASCPVIKSPNQVRLGCFNAPFSILIISKFIKCGSANF